MSVENTVRGYTLTEEGANTLAGMLADEPERKVSKREYELAKEIKRHAHALSAYYSLLWIVRIFTPKPKAN
jgi:hypothetical protein